MQRPTIADVKPPKAEAAERVLSISAVFPVPRARMFELWTQPEHKRHWYMPRGAKVEVHEDDVRVGGRYRVTMLDEEDAPHIVSGEYRELSHERIVFSHHWEGEPAAFTLVTVLLTEEGGNTRVTLHHGVFASRDAREMHEQGWDSIFENLNEYVTRARG
jgi:uncharacterized protein YndB with AHSA1/START domain